MYREILSTPIELTECVIIFECKKCGYAIPKPEICEVSGQRADEGHEHICIECRSTLIENKK